MRFFMEWKSLLLLRCPCAENNHSFAGKEKKPTFHILQKLFNMKRRFFYLKYAAASASYEAGFTLALIINMTERSKESISSVTSVIGRVQCVT